MSKSDKCRHLHPLTLKSLWGTSCPSYGVLSRLRKLEPGAPPSAYGQLLDCMCSWGKTAGVLELIIDWLSEALPENQVVCLSVCGVSVIMAMATLKQLVARGHSNR